MEERWIRVMLDDGGSILLKGTTFLLDLASPVVKIYGPGPVQIGCFPLSRVIAVVDEEKYQEGCEKAKECCDSECNLS